MHLEAGNEIFQRIAADNMGAYVNIPVTIVGQFKRKAGPSTVVLETAPGGIYIQKLWLIFGAVEVSVNGLMYPFPEPTDKLFLEVRGRPVNGQVININGDKYWNSFGDSSFGKAD
jgi:hypothetical protein